MTEHPYHTAIGKHQNELAGAKPRDYWAAPHGVAFTQDAGDFWRVEFGECDVIYSEPAWRPGYDKFHARVGIEPARSWNEFMQAIEANVRRLGVPAAIATGSQGLAQLQPDASQPMTLRDGEGVLALYHGLRVTRKEDVDIVHELASLFQCVGDPACGYGRTGRIFNNHGKRFVMSDISAECIGYIAKNAMTW
jgi:hypothetical protein